MFCKLYCYSKGLLSNLSFVGQTDLYLLILIALQDPAVDNFDDKSINMDIKQICLSIGQACQPINSGAEMYLKA